MDTAQKPAAAHGLIERPLIIAAAFRRDNRPLFSTDATMQLVAPQH
jgi:hypothetical protein